MGHLKDVPIKRSRNRDGTPVFTKSQYGKIRSSGGIHTTRRTKAVFWCLLLFAASTYTLITATGLEYPRPTFLQCIMSKEKQKQNHEDKIKIQYPHDPNEDVEWGKLQEVRVRRVSEACSALNLTQELDMDILKHILVDKKHQALFCFVPKVACTSWKRLWFWLSGILNDDEDVKTLPRSIVHGKNLPTLASYRYTKEKKTEMLKTYKKFIFVRHPLERLVSAFRDKLENEDLESTFDFHKEVGQEVQKIVRGKQVTGEVQNVTFSEFVQWITPVNGTWTFAQRNEHWRPVVDLCAPCAVQYDVIGKYEKLQKEMNATLHWLGAAEYTNRFPPPDRSFQSDKNHRGYLSRLTADDRLRFLRTYLLDFLLFGYTMP